VRSLLLAGSIALLAACGNDEMTAPTPLDPATAPRVPIDRFGPGAMLFQRTESNGLPTANAPVNFDVAPFITDGLGPSGEMVRYYNFDVMPVTAAPIYVLFRQGSSEPVDGQLNIIDVTPGSSGYNDFWRVVRVTVPVDYVANTVTSRQDIIDAGHPMTTTDMLVNCPVVPDGSTASLGGGADGLTMGWYRDQVVFYLNFGEAPLTVTEGQVPTSPIFVTFNINPDQTGGGPASGFRTENDGVQTHNVVSTLPGQNGYSPLWEVIPYDNAAFPDVSNLTTALAAMNFGTAALVNCPVVFIQN
jgi:hypothetical protein